MVFRSQVALITIPIVFALGVIWFRRKKVHSDSGGKKSTDTTAKLNTAANNNDNTTEDTQTDQTQSICVPSEQSPCKPKTTPPNRFGKSAPIDITPHKTSPKRTASTTAAPAEAKGAEDGKAEDGKALNSIEESSSCDSVDLPGSSNCRRRFSYTIRTNEPRVIVKATHMDARDLNKSPQSSFEQLTSPSDSERTLDADLIKPKMVDKKPMADTANVTTAETVAKPNSHVLPVASPPLSLCSNKSNRSQESGDSGQGGSISSPSNSENGALETAIQTFDFQLPQSIVKFLVGKNGVTVRRIRDQAKVQVHIRRHPINPSKFKWCAIEGTAKQIEDALAIIKNKLPPKTKIDKIDMELELNALQENNQIIDPNMLQLHLIEGINNDIVISSIVTAGHLFVQQPFHPSYPSLNFLQTSLNKLYAGQESPMLPEYQETAICVGQVDTHWYRLQILQHVQENNTCLAKYLDFGGYCEIATSELRQIRFDCVSLPFQAIECLLADIKPKGDEWSIEAAQLVMELTQARALQAQVVGYTESGIPEIYLYITLGPNNIVFVNEELVARNYADWINVA